MINQPRRTLYLIHQQCLLARDGRIGKTEAERLRLYTAALATIETLARRHAPWTTGDMEEQ